MNWKVLLLCLILNGCSVLDRKPSLPETKQVEVVTVVEPAPQYHPPLPNKVNTLPVEWTVLTPSTMEEYLTDLQEGNAPTNAFYGLSTKGYENLSHNMAEIKRYIRQVLSIIDYYKESDNKEEVSERID